jgi:hypothetical protein
MGAAAIIAVIDGMHLHEFSRDPDARNRLIGWSFQRLTATL